MIRDLVNENKTAKEEDRKMFGSENSLGKCPSCGGDVLWGKYGPYCTEKCGMSLKKALGKDLDKDELVSLLEGKKTLINGLKSQSGGTYDAYLIPDGVEEYSYTNKDGNEVEGKQIKFKMEYKNK